MNEQKNEKFILLEEELKGLTELQERIKFLFNLYDQKWYNRKEREKILKDINDTIRQLRAALFEKKIRTDIIAPLGNCDKSWRNYRLAEILEKIELGKEIIRRNVTANNKKVLESQNPENRASFAYEFKKVTARNEYYAFKNLFETRKNLKNSQEYPYEKRMEMLKRVESQINNMLWNSQVIIIKRGLCWNNEEQVQKIYDAIEKQYLFAVKSTSKMKEEKPNIPFKAFSNEQYEQVIQSLGEKGKDLILEIYKNECPEEIVTKEQLASKKEEFKELIRKIGKLDVNKYNIEIGMLLTSVIGILSMIPPTMGQELGITYQNGIATLCNAGFLTSYLGLPIETALLVANRLKGKEKNKEKNEVSESYQKCKQEASSQLALAKEMLKQYKEQYNIPNIAVVDSYEHIRLRK